ncbi:hypothetical protein Y032_0388g487 [Ancylostoma ceylanicum]|uniref:Uncharacterized protein n=1 Tax=Ancylostoma ceylanicum TaxID=53326 RepID=A0A016RS75_9BILA|nr:hypothetical protein Y032_0388g487 [Ancylostoma ceylanicum]
MRILLFVSLLMMYVHAESIRDWSDMSIEQVLRTVLGSLPIGENLFEQLKAFDWESLLKKTYKDKFPAELKWPEGLKELRDGFVGYSGMEAPMNSNSP